MSHVDEGLLHAYLDGALHAEAEAVAREVDHHLALCGDCRARLDEAARLRDLADTVLAAAEPAGIEEPPPFEILLARRETATPDPAAAVASNRPGRPTRPMPLGLAWAATVILALGAGWWARQLSTPGHRAAEPARAVEESSRDRAMAAAPTTPEASPERSMDPVPSTAKGDAVPHLPPTATDEAAVLAKSETSAAPFEERGAGAAAITAPDATTPSADATLAATTRPDTAGTTPVTADTWLVVDRAEAERRTGGRLPAVPELPVIETAVAANDDRAVRVRQRLENGDTLEIVWRPEVLALDEIVVTGTTVRAEQSEPRAAAMPPSRPSTTPPAVDSTGARAGRPRTGVESRVEPKAASRTSARTDTRAADRAAPPAAPRPETAAGTGRDPRPEPGIVEAVRLGYRLTARAPLPTDSLRALLDRVH